MGLRTQAFIIVFIVALALCSPAYAQGTQPPPPEPVILTDNQGVYPLGLQLEILEDPTGELTIQDVAAVPYANRFIPSEKKVPTFGYTKSTYWVRYRLRNESRLNDHWLVLVDFPNTHYVDLYYPSPDGEGYAAKKSGVLRPFANRDIDYPQIVFEIPLPFQEEQVIYTRIQSEASMTLGLTVLSQKAFSLINAREQLLLGMFYGALLITLGYNLFLLFTLREVSYLYYVCFLACAILFFGSYDALTVQYLWRDWFQVIYSAMPVFFILLVGSITVFSDNFLETKLRHPKLHRLNVIVIVGWALALLVLPFVSYHAIAVWVDRYTLITLSLAGLTGLISWFDGYKPARFYLVSWTGFFVGAILTILVRMGYLPSTYLTEHLYQYGLMWLAMWWSIALADRINLLKEEKEQARKETEAGEMRYRRLVERMHEGLAIIDDESRLTFVNPGMSAMMGYTTYEMTGKLLTEFLDEKNQQIAMEQLALRKTGATTPYELAWRRRDGSEMFTIVSPMPLYTAGGRYNGAMAIITNITERVQASRVLEQRINERTRDLSTLLELANETAALQGLNPFLNRILERLKTIVDYRDSAVIVFEQDRWRIRAGWPVGLGKLEDPLLTNDETGTLTRALQSGKPVLLNKLHREEPLSSGLQALETQLPQVFHAGENTWLGVPLIRNDRVLGLMLLGQECHDSFSQNQVQVAEAFARKAAIEIENHQLIEQAQITAAAEERNRLARELHDSVTQVLFSVSLLAEVLPQIWRRDPELGLQRLDKLRRLTRGALAEMRTMLLELRPSAVINTPLGDLLAQLTEAVTSRTGLPFQLFIEQVPSLPAEVQMAFYRVAQESLNNVVKHAQAQHVTVSLSATPLSLETDDALGQEVMLVIQDDGVGYKAGSERSNHLGIGIMRERAAAIQAVLTLESQPGYGTRVSLSWDSETEDPYV